MGVISAKTEHAHATGKLCRTVKPALIRKTNFGFRYFGTVSMVPSWFCLRRPSVGFSAAMDWIAVFFLCLTSAIKLGAPRESPTALEQESSTYLDRNPKCEYECLCQVECTHEEVCEVGLDDIIVFPFFLGPSFVRFPNDPCTGENGLKGTCYSRLECTKLGGFASGTCAKGLGCCCIFKRTCGESTNVNCTYFTNPEYPAPYKGGDSPCTLTVWKCYKGICQLRLDLIDFNLAEPDATGTCTDDFLLVTGSASNFKRICGMNTGQHVYVDFVGEAPLELLIDTNSALAVDRRWNIKVTQVDCCVRAPVGCLMQYTATSGKVKSFNYSPLPSTAPEDPNVPGPGNRQLANMNYGVCIQMLPGYCSIEWSQNPSDKYSFTVSGDTEALDDTLLGTPSASLMGEKCTTNFVVIPNPTVNGTPSTSDRFCGNGFPTVVSSSKPFVLTVVTNSGLPTDMPDVGNRGFCLCYRQLPCS